jgi:hypothetical protein
LRWFEGTEDEIQTNKLYLNDKLFHIETIANIFLSTDGEKHKTFVLTITIKNKML